MRFLLVTSRSRRMFDGGRSFAIRFIEDLEARPLWCTGHRADCRKGVEFYTIVSDACCAPGSERLSHADGRNLQGLPVLGDRAARDHDALLAQNLGNLAVRQGTLRVLGRNQLLDQCPDRGGGACTAGLCRDVTSEEILELEDAARREHEF